MGIVRLRKQNPSVGIEVILAEEGTSAYKVKYRLLAESILSLWMIVGVEGFVSSLLKLDSNMFFLLPVSMAVILLCGFVWRSLPMRLAATGILSLWMGVLIAWTRDDMINGLRLFANHISDTLGSFYGKIFPQYMVYANPEDYVVCETLFLLPVVTVLAFLGVYLVQSKSRLLTGLILLAAFAAQLRMGDMASFLWLCTLLLAGIVLLTWQNYLGELFQTLGLAAICFLSVLGLCRISGTEEWEGAAILKNAALRAVEDIRYQTGSGGILPEGNFLEAGELALEDAEGVPALEIIMSEPESYYLRGYVGEEYTKSAWQQADTRKLYEYRDLFYWLHREDYYGQTQLAGAALLLKDTGGESEEDMLIVNEIHVSNVSASRKYRYEPYELLNYSHAQDDYGAWIGDSRNPAEGWFGEGEYDYLALPSQIPGSAALTAALSEQEQQPGEELQAYLEQESYYNSFVYDLYTQVPEHVRNLLRNHLGDEKLEPAEAREKILTLLSGEVRYGTQVDAMPVGKDFLQYFLEESGCGYSVHYATAAVLMLRYYGIPARYVEGYLITPEDVRKAQPGDTVTIPEDHAHAWAEYYQDGIGWIPFETTPAYLNVMEQPQTISGFTPPSEEETEENLELTDDNYEPDETEYTDRVLPYPVLFIILSGLLLSVILILTLRSRMIHRKWERRLHQPDHRKTVLAAMSYCLWLGRMAEGIHTSDYRAAAEVWGELRDLIPVYEKARYSELSIQEEERRQAITVTEDMKQRLLHAHRGIMRITDKIIYFFRGL